MMYRLEKLLFPKLQRWERRRQLKHVFIAAAASLALAALFILICLVKNEPGR